MAQVAASVLCTAALRKIRAIDPDETPTATELANVFDEFKRMIKTWGVAGNLVWSSVLDTHTLTAGTASYTIGSGGDINTTRPHAVKNGSYVNSGGLDYELTIVGESRYLGISQKGMNVPDASRLIWYKPEYPLGKIYLYPPGGGTLNLYSWKALAEPATVNAEIVFPDEYQDAINWNLCCRIKPEFVGDPSPYEMAMAQFTRDELVSFNEANDPAELANEMALLNPGISSYSINAG